jgi:hypothetical protein
METDFRARPPGLRTANRLTPPGVTTDPIGWVVKRSRRATRVDPLVALRAVQDRAWIARVRFDRMPNGVRLSDRTEVSPDALVYGFNNTAIVAKGAIVPSVIAVYIT